MKKPLSILLTLCFLYSLFTPLLSFHVFADSRALPIVAVTNQPVGTCNGYAAFHTFEAYGEYDLTAHAEPADYSALDNLENVVRDLTEDLYTAESWANLTGALADVNYNEDILHQANVDAYAVAVRDAIDALVFNDLEEIQIAQSFYSDLGGSPAWTNSSMIFTEPEYGLSEYKMKRSANDSSPMTIASWLRIFCAPTDDAVIDEESGMYDKYVITNIKGTLDSTQVPVTDDEVVSQNKNLIGDDWGGYGFVLAINVNAHSYFEGNESQYASQEFGNRNKQAYENLALSVGDIVCLHGVINPFFETGDISAVDLDVTGTWVHRYGEFNGMGAPDPTPIYRVSPTVNENADVDGPQYLARDQFEDFFSSATLTRYVAPQTADPGDVNANGVVDLLDLSDLLDRLCGTIVSGFDPINADCNADGQVDLFDAVLLAKYMAGWNVTLGPTTASATVSSGITVSVDSVSVPYGENVISVPVRISGLTDADDLGAIQLNVAYDTEKLRLTNCKTYIGKGKNRISYSADYFDEFACSDTEMNVSPFSLIALTTETENQYWDSDYELNDSAFVVLDFEVLGIWTDTIPLILSGTALRRSDDAPLQMSFENGSGDPVRVSGVELNSDELTVKINESSSLTAIISPANARLKVLTWASSDSSIATVENGILTAKKPGTAVITVMTTDGGFTDTCAVTVYCGHESTTLIGYRNPSCSQEGYTGDTYCTICNGLLQLGSSIPTIPHTPANTWVNNASKHWHVCSVCGERVGIEEHAFVEIPNVQYLKSVATCISPAQYYKSCSICGYRSEETFIFGKKISHTYQRVDAYTVQCSVCDHVQNFGDLNGDGIYNISDISMLAKAISGWTMGNTYHADGADCNGDEILDVADVVRLAKKVAGWSVVLGPAE